MKIAIDTADWPLESALDLAGQVISYHLTNPPQPPLAGTDGRLDGRVTVRVVDVGDGMVAAVFYPMPTTADPPAPPR